MHAGLNQVRTRIKAINRQYDADYAEWNTNRKTYKGIMGKPENSAFQVWNLTTKKYAGSRKTLAEAVALNNEVNGSGKAES